MLGSICAAVLLYLLSNTYIPFEFRTVYSYKWTDTYFEEDNKCFDSFQHKLGFNVCFRIDGKLHRKYEEKKSFQIYLKHALAVLCVIFFYGLLRYLGLIDNLIGNGFRWVNDKWNE